MCTDHHTKVLLLYIWVLIGVIVSTQPNLFLRVLSAVVDNTSLHSFTGPSAYYDKDLTW